MVRSRPDPATDLAKTAKIRPDLDGFGQNGWDLAGSGRVRLDSGQTYSLEFDNRDRSLPDSGGICETLIFACRNFFMRAKRRKIFSKKSFFFKMISLKIFYDRNHFTSKQTEY